MSARACIPRALRAPVWKNNAPHLSLTQLADVNKIEAGMKILSLKDLTNFHHETVITDGGFDGIHVGHKTIISETVMQAKENGLKSVLVTFRRPPRLFFHPECNLLTTLDEKIELLSGLGLDFILLLDFLEVKGLEAEDFVQDIILDGLNGRRMVIGFNHHFGHGGRGNSELLVKNIDRWRIFLTVVPPVFVDGFPVSSSLIRQLIASGRVEDAMFCLGHPYFITGEVIRGRGVGREIGYPTANIAVPEGKLLPANGVYAAYCELKGETYPAAVFIGYRKTLGDGEHSVEAHLIDFDGSLYGEKIRLKFIRRIRDERKFDSLKALREQISKDIAEIKAVLQ